MGGRMCKRASKPRPTHGQRVGCRHTQKWSMRKAQTSLACTQPIQEMEGHGSEVREGMVWRWGDRKTYFRVPAQALLKEMSC